jgi:hypothetical protein
MKKALISGVVVSALTFSIILLLLSGTYAQENEGKAPPNEEKAPRERFKDAMRKEFRKEHKIDELMEGKKWLDDVKKYRDEIIALEDELKPVREEVRNLFRQHQKAATEDEKKAIEAKLDEAMSKEDELDLAIAKKKKEFSEKNFKLALERVIEAEVEYRDTERKIWIRREFIGRHFPEGEGLRKHGPKEKGEPEGPPFEGKNPEDNPPPFKSW